MKLRKKIGREPENIKLLNNKLAIHIRIRGVVRTSWWPSKPMTRVQIPAGPYIFTVEK